MQLLYQQQDIWWSCSRCSTVPWAATFQLNRARLRQVWNLSGYVRVLQNMHNCTWEDVVMHMGCAENLDFTKCLFLQQKFKSHFIPMASQNKGKRELDNKFWWVLFFLPFEISVSTWVCGHFGQNLLPPILDFSTEGLSQNTAFQVQYNVNITCADEIQCMRGLFTPISTPK